MVLPAQKRSVHVGEARQRLGELVVDALFLFGDSGRGVEGRWCMNRQTPQRFPNASIQSQALIEMDSGRPISVIRFRMLQAINASASCDFGCRARSL